MMRDLLLILYGSVGALVTEAATLKFIRWWRSRTTRTLPSTLPINVIGQFVLPDPDDEQWAIHNTTIDLDGVEVWPMSRTVTLHGCSMSGPEWRAYGNAVVDAYLARKAGVKL